MIIILRWADRRMIKSGRKLNVCKTFNSHVAKGNKWRSLWNPACTGMHGEQAAKPPTSRLSSTMQFHVNILDFSIFTWFYVDWEIRILNETYLLFTFKIKHWQTDWHDVIIMVLIFHKFILLRFRHKRW